jgi:predicted GIY-YIG superfamily endonuclease
MRYHSKITYLYRHYDRRGKLLYVGISNDPKRRIKEHKDKEWYKYITKVTYVKYKTRDKALKEEEKAIKKEKPIYNKVHNRNRSLTEYKTNRILDNAMIVLVIILILIMFV